MPRVSKRMGVGAHVNAPAKALAPQERIRELFPESFADSVIEDLLVVGLEPPPDNPASQDLLLKVQWSQQTQIQPHNAPQEFFWVKPTLVKLTEAGPPEKYFVHTHPPVLPIIQLEPIIDDEPEEGFDFVDDDDNTLGTSIHLSDELPKQPTPIGHEQPPPKEDKMAWAEWGHQDVDYRGTQAPKPATINTGNPEFCSVLSMFESLIPKEYIMSQVLYATNEAGKTCPTWREMHYGEFLRWLGLYFYFGCFHKSRSFFWSPNQDALFPSANVSAFMSRKRFLEINKYFCVSRLASPTDRYSQMRPFLAAWNENMSKNFSPSMLSSLGKTRCHITDRYEFHGPLTIPRSPRPGQEDYFVLADADTNMVYWAELNEGQLRPPEVPPLKYTTTLDARTALCLRATEEADLWGTGRILVLNHEFASLRALYHLKKHGVFASSEMTSFNSNLYPELAQRLVSQPVGSIACRPGTFNDEPLYAISVKDTANLPAQVATYGTSSGLGEVKDRSTAEQRLVVQYPEAIYNFLAARRAPAVHTKLRTQYRPLEEVMAPKKWWKCHFAFLMGVAETNAFLAYNRFVKKPDEHLSWCQFRQLLARELLNNHYLLEELTVGVYPRDAEVPPMAIDASETFPKRARSMGLSHRLESIPCYSTWDGSAWRPTLKVQQVQRRCRFCKKKTRHYCICTPAKSVCSTCFAEHMVQELS
eukprot:m.30455 g.30455  ORF g.30455 m.30455 type:complete len:701 (-) comp9277_c0_seq1:195-2297(-)